MTFHTYEGNMDLSQICSISDPATLSQMLIVPPDHCYWNRHYDS